MQTKLVIARRVAWLSLAMGFAAIACGDDAGSKSSSSAGGEAMGGSAQESPGKQDGGAAADGDAGEGQSPRAGSMNEPDGPVQPGAGGSGSDSPDFDGIDLGGVPTETAPAGCVGGFDAELGALSIELGGDVSAVHLTVRDGVIHANGVPCESAAGDAALATDVLTLAVQGGAAAEQVFLDLSEGPFSGCFSAAGAIAVDLGEGEDAVHLMGTLGEDVIHAGTEEGELIIDVDADQRADIRIVGAPKIVVSTSAKNDVIRGDGLELGAQPAALPLWLYGGGAGDELAGGDAADHLFGGIGNDWLDAGSSSTGGDIFDGGDGTDTADFSARTEPLSITMGAGADDGEADEAADVADSVEELLGGQGSNTITGGPASNTIWGGPEADILSGGPGDDFLIGGDGGDSLSGDAGNDTLYGEEGDDDLLGGAEDDLLDGGPGKDALDGGLGDGDICIATGDTVKACEL